METKDKASFGGFLRRVREASGLSQEGLAARAGISAKAVGALERGERKRPHPHTARSLADALGLSDEDMGAFMDASMGRAAPEKAAPADELP
ncbi:MAG: helix-turn-helix domain-containing protein, partial [Rubrobacteraceae bacterium]